MLNKMQPDPIFANLTINPFSAYKTLLFRGRPWDLIKKPFPFFWIEIYAMNHILNVGKDVKVNMIFAVECRSRSLSKLFLLTL